MQRAKDQLQETLYAVAKPAVRRLLDGEHVAGSLFDEGEEKQLAAALAAVYGTADLFGRARVAIRAQEAAKRAENPAIRAKRFNDEPTDFAATFGSEPLPPLKPLDALDYFLKLIPSLNLDPERWGATLERHAFTLAVNTGQRMLEDVRQVIADRFESGGVIGQGKTGLAGKINDVLEAAGVTPKNPQYAEMVARTNTMDGLTTGTTKQIQEMSDTFPAWKYSAITRDGRSRKSHAAKNGLIFAADLSFAEVRGTEAKDACNCRCVPIPVDKWDLQAHVDGGGRLITSWSPYDNERLAA